MDDHTFELLSEAAAVWAAKRPRNALRKAYRDSKQSTRIAGLAVPAQMRQLSVAVGLPDLAVESLASRVMWDGTVAPTGGEDPFELADILEENRFDVELPQAVDSSLMHSVAFVSTLKGDSLAGDPSVIVAMHSAELSGGVWDRARRQLRSLFVALDVDAETGEVTRYMLMTADAIWQYWWNGRRWVTEPGWPRHNPLRRVPAEALPYAPTLDRPLGQSRINRRVMSQTDRAIAAILRLEVHSEMFAAIKLLMMGADADTFKDVDGKPIPLGLWYSGRMNVVPRNEDESLPVLEVIKQQSPQPHIDTIRAIYSQFSGETKVPLNSLGIVADNPESAEAIQEAKEGLTILARNYIRTITYPLNRVMQNVVMLRDGMTEPTPELRRISQRFRNPAMPSIVSQSDAMVKQVAAIPWLAETTVALEELGYSEDQILRLLSEKARAQGTASARDIIEAAKRAAPEPDLEVIPDGESVTLV